MNFVHLHTHSHYSILDGLSKIPEMVKRAAELGMPALALTDHGSLGGAYELYRECNTHGIKPIIGCEFYQAPKEMGNKQPHFWAETSKRDVDVSGTGAHTHLTILATSAEGLRNLYRLQRTAFVTGFYRKPRIDTECVAEFATGLTVLSGCMGGAVATRIRLGQLDEAYAEAEKFRELFPGQYFIELMNHGNEADAQINPVLLDIGRTLDLPVVLTNDSHYTHSDDSYTHEALCCLNTRRTLAEGSFFRDAGEGFHLRSYEEMEAARIGGSLPEEAISNTLAIADSVGDYAEVFDSSVKMPVVENANYNLRESVLIGLYERLDNNHTPEYEDQLAFELDTITSLGYSEYFLVVADVCREATQQSIRFNTRGSAAGSLVGYCLGIHDIDPLEHRLVFERFLNPSRASLPDIDLDVAASGRDYLLNYLANKYGEDYVAQVGTYGFLKAKRALDDSARVMGRPTSVAKALKAHLPPPKFGRSYDLDWKYFQDLEDEEEKETLAETDFSEASDREVVDLATRLEGTIRSEGIHAAGVIVTPKPVYELLPVRKPGGKGLWVTGFHNQNSDPQLENLGYLKFDFLGLRNLEVIDECFRMLGVSSESQDFRMPSTYDDPATFELLSRGDTLGVFQLDSSGMRGLLKKLKPTKLDDIVAVLALFRPGPMGVNAHLKYAERKQTVIHPELDETLCPILGDTYGLVVYQEQVLDILKTICGWSYAEADLVFGAMRKKLTAKMEAAKPEYDAAGKSRGFSQSALQALWNTLVPFADYSFNKAHATSYAIVAYQTAFLKANYGLQFMAVLLGSVADDQRRLPQYLNECSRMGIPVLPPDINTSEEGFTVDGTAIRYGLSAIKGVGSKAYKSITKQRPFSSLTDYLTRATGNASNSGVVTALARAGALDAFTDDRKKLIPVVAELAQRGAYIRECATRGEVPLVPVQLRSQSTPWSAEEVKSAEKVVLGGVVTQDPICLKLRRPLTEPEWELVRKIIGGSPGNVTVWAETPSGQRFDTGGRVTPTEKTRLAFSVLPIEVG